MHVKSLKLLFSAFAALIVCSSVWGNPGEYYTLYTKAELKAALMNDTLAHIEIMADIDMGGEGPITTQFMDDDHESRATPSENWDPSCAGFRFYDLPPSGELTIDDLPNPDDNRFFRLTAE